MTQEQIRKILLQLEVPEGEAFMRAKEDASGGLPWLANYLFVYNLNKSLRFYDEEYAQLLKEGKIESSEADAILKAGVSPEMLAEFAYELVLQAYDSVLYAISDSTYGLQEIEFEREEQMEPLPKWNLAEVDGEGNYPNEKNDENIYPNNAGCIFHVDMCSNDRWSTLEE